METIDYALIRDSVLDRLMQAVADADNTLLARLKRAANMRLRRIWEHQFWPELMVTEERWFRDRWSAEALYVELDEVFYPATSKYYQSLRGEAGVAPTDASEWSECRRVLSGGDWVVGKGYKAGDVVRNPIDGMFYGCRFDHVAVTFPGVNWMPVSEFVQRFDYEQAGKTTIGRVKGVWSDDPRGSGTARELEWYDEGDGVVVVPDMASVWVTFRKRCPRLAGELYSATRSYLPGDQVLYTGSDGVENFYDCVLATAEGNAPDGQNAMWTLVEIPKRFDEYLAQGVYADLLTSEGQNEKRLAEDRAANEILLREVLRVRGAAMRGAAGRMLVKR